MSYPPRTTRSLYAAQGIRMASDDYEPCADREDLAVEPPRRFMRRTAEAQAGVDTSKMTEACRRWGCWLNLFTRKCNRCGQ